MRTTSNLESYNSRLLQNLPKKGNFYKFMKRIADEELAQSHDMALLVESGGGTVARLARKRKYKDKDTLIKEATDFLERGSITTMEFLRRVTYDNKIVDSSLAKYVVPWWEYVSDNEHSSDDEIYEDDDLDQPSTSVAAIAAAAIADEQLCAICKDRKRNTLYLPCRDLKMCDQCATELRVRCPGDAQMECPFCHAIVENVIAGIFI